jgi:hypothetical protein
MKVIIKWIVKKRGLIHMDQRRNGQVLYTVCSQSRCALRLRYVDLVVSIEAAVEVCCCFTVFSFYSLWFFQSLPTPCISAQRLSEHTLER